MAVVTRWFSTVAAGAGDGTSWANRAALLPSGNWSSIITGFNFAGSDSLHCLLGPGTYSCSQSLASTLFTNVPTVLNNLSLLPCDSSGSLIRTWDSSWVSSQPAWDSSTMPVIQTSTNISTIAGINIFIEGIKFVATGRTGGAVHESTSSQSQFISNCVFENQASGSSVRAGFFSAATNVSNTIYKCSGTAYSSVLRIVNTGVLLENCRIEGNKSATSGNRHGYDNSSGQAQTIFNRCTVINNVGNGFDFNVGQNQSGLSTLNRCLVANNDGHGVIGYSVATKQTVGNLRRFDKTVIVNNGGWAVNQQTDYQIHTYISCRMRNNASGKFSLGGTGNFYEIDPDDSAGTDADEFVDAASGDYRIKKTSSLWGKGLGPGDEPSSGSLILPSVSGWAY